MNKTRIVDGAILAVIVSLLLWGALSQNGSGVSVLVGKPAPPFKLKTQSGAVVGTPDYTGKVVLLDFWATWCSPCFRQMPALQQLKSKYVDDVVVLAVNVDEPSSGRVKAMEKFIRSAKIDVDSLMDDGSVSSMYGAATIPALVLIDRQGVVRYASSGVHTVSELEGQIESVLEDSE